MKKILYVSSVLPDTSCGARIALYRHFVLKQDFQVAISSYNLSNKYIPLQYEIKRGFFGRILHKTRFAKFYFNFVFVYNWYFLPKGLLSFASNFNPDIIMTVPDNIHTGFALSLSKKLQKPLIVNFQDLVPLSQFFPDYCRPYNWTRRFLMMKYFNLDRVANCSLYTSEGMRDYFGNQSKGKVMYPIGDFNYPKFEINQKDSENDVFTLVYAGNCYGSYGRMLLRLAKRIIKTEGIHLKIFPVGRDWAEEEIELLRKENIYQSFLPFERLRKELRKADGFLTVMSFEENDKPFVQTSFTTKWLDYAPYGKPIFVWAPPYSSAAVFALEHSCGWVCSKNDDSFFLQECFKLIENKSDFDMLSKNTKSVSMTILNPNNIHNTLKSSIEEAINR